MRKAAAAVLAFSLVLTALSVIIPYMYLSDTGIIGGADGPTAVFYARSSAGKVYFTAFICGCAAVLSSICCIVSASVFDLRCAAYALGMSLSTGGGISCLLIFLSCYIMSSPEKHPIAHPASVVCGLLCLGIFCLLFGFYFRRRSKLPGKKGIVSDVIIYLLWLFPSVYAAEALYQTLAGYIG